MKPLSEMTHYEVLEVEPEASGEDIERAYRVARSTYGEDSVATYSVLDSQDTTQIMERVEVAYRVLVDPAGRGAYDLSLRGDGESATEEDANLAIEFAETAQRSKAPRDPGAIHEFGRIEGESDHFDGAALRRARLLRGLELDQIASVTKIRPSYLTFLEEERFDELPAPVYVRGFVMAFARSMGIDADLVASTYMERHRSWEATRSPVTARGESA